MVHASASTRDHQAQPRFLPAWDDSMVHAYVWHAGRKRCEQKKSRGCLKSSCDSVRRGPYNLYLAALQKTAGVFCTPHGIEQASHPAWPDFSDSLIELDYEKVQGRKAPLIPPADRETHMPRVPQVRRIIFNDEEIG